MRLPTPPANYRRDHEGRRNFIIEQEDARNRKRNQDVELGGEERLILSSPDGTRYQIKVDNAGNLSTAAV